MSSNKKIYMYSGNIIGNKEGISNYCKKVALRRTRLYWITIQGIKFHAETGKGMGPCPPHELDLATIEPLDKPMSFY